jgi:hypothetical protein
LLDARAVIGRVADSDKNGRKTYTLHLYAIEVRIYIHHCSYIVNAFFSLLETCSSTNSMTKSWRNCRANTVSNITHTKRLYLNFHQLRISVQTASSRQNIPHCTDQKKPQNISRF